MTGSRSAVVFGASGFIGRWLVKELLSQGVPTTVVVRSDTSSAHLLRWLDEHDVRARPAVVRADLELEDLGWREADAPVAAEVYNMAGAYAFGMSTRQARAANVDTARRIVSFAATLPGPVRLVHLSGYRVGGQDPTAVPWTPERVATEHRRLGAYEASKVESDAVVQAHAKTVGVTPHLRFLICCSSSASTTASRCPACGSPPVCSDDSPPRSQGRIPRP